MQAVLLTAVSQVFVAFYLLWPSAHKHQAERYLWYYLALSLVHFSIKFIFGILLENQLLFQHFATPISLGYAPMLFFYIETTKHGRSPSLKAHWLHLLPLLIFTILYLLVGVYTLFTHDLDLLFGYKQLTRYAFILSSGVYFPYLLYAVHKVQLPTLNWLKIQLTLWLIHMLIFSINYVFHLPLRYSFFIYSGTIMTFYFVISVLQNIYGKKSAESELNIASEVSSYLEKNRNKYEKSGLNAEQAKAYVEQLQKLMQKEKLYLNQGLSLADLALRIGVSKHHLTEALNGYCHKNFFQFVNEYRIEEAKQRMLMGSLDNLFQLADACGFNSKTTFIKYFKQLEGITPSEYREQLQVAATGVM